MNNLKHLESFIFNYAEYKLADKQGNKGVLKVYYSDNKYKVEAANKKLIKEASEIAKDLLQRKHGVNFANK